MISPMLKLRFSGKLDFFEWIHQIQQNFHDIFHKANDKYKKFHDQHRVPHKFWVEDKVWFHL